MPADASQRGREREREEVMGLYAAGVQEVQDDRPVHICVHNICAITRRPVEEHRLLHRVQRTSMLRESALAKRDRRLS
ncbi:hypothetical protein D4764_20G0000570 [Takifugu flavidus]|uniref:Uncharacterized protein n=1 Tax=Takifugu flavidus TaxID=433684 RepID=A0A5C6NG93_9TELE|nr:hypothetical protein D4764_20G0000570 [Takifugu flavidus]